MSTFRYDTKFRGATTNKGAIKLAPKFVNCPTCGFTRVENRSKVIKKESSKKYHIYSPVPNINRNYAFICIAYDNKPEELFNVADTFEIYANSIQSYSIKYIGNYPNGQGIVTLFIDNGSKITSIDTSLEHEIGTIGAYIGAEFLATSNKEPVKITFEDGDSISFDVYSEENFRPAKYHIYIPENVYSDSSIITIKSNNIDYIFNGNKGVNAYYDNIESYSIKFLETEEDVFVLIIDNGTKLVKATPDEGIVINDSPYGTMLISEFTGSKSLLLEFEDGDAINTIVERTIIPKTFDYEMFIDSTNYSKDIHINVDDSDISIFVNPGTTKLIKFNKLNSIVLFGPSNETFDLTITHKNSIAKSIDGYTEDLGFTISDLYSSIADKLENGKLSVYRSTNFDYTTSTILFEDGNSLLLPIKNNYNTVCIRTKPTKSTKTLIRDITKLIRTDIENRAFFRKDDPSNFSIYKVNNFDLEKEDIYFTFEYSDLSIDFTFEVKENDNPNVTEEIIDGIKYIKVPIGEEASLKIYTSYTIGNTVANDYYIHLNNN